MSLCAACSHMVKTSSIRRVRRKTRDLYSVAFYDHPSETGRPARLKRRDALEHARKNGQTSIARDLKGARFGGRKNPENLTSRCTYRTEIAWLSSAVAAGVEAWRSVRPEETGSAGAGGEPGELRVAGEPIDAGDLADQLRGEDHSEATLGEQLRRDLVHQRHEFFVELVDRAGQIADPADLIVCDREARVALGAR